jgi:hypothetical protein
MDSNRRMDFSYLGPLITAYSRAMVRAVEDLARRVRDFITRTATLMWRKYYRLERSVASVVVDFTLALYALRLPLAILALGVGLIYWRLWIALVVYLVIVGAAVSIFRRPTESEIQEETTAQATWRATLTHWLQIGLRIFVAGFLFFYFGHGNRIYAGILAQIEAERIATHARTEEQRRAETFKQMVRDAAQRNGAVSFSINNEIWSDAIDIPTGKRASWRLSARLAYEVQKSDGQVIRIEPGKDRDISPITSVRFRLINPNSAPVMMSVSFSNMK